MPYRVTCPNPSCRKSAQVPDEFFGKTVCCRGCSGRVTIGGATTTLADGSPLGYTVEDDSPARPAATQVPPKADNPPTVPPTDRGTNEREVRQAAAGEGERLGRFVIRQRLGAGAFGSVYRAYDPQLDREVAVKVPHDAVLENPKRVERFFREARAAAGLRHPNIVPVYDSGQTDGRYFIASAFIVGKPIEEIVEEKGIDFHRAAAIVRKVAEGLAYAHGREWFTGTSSRPTSCSKRTITR